MTTTQKVRWRITCHGPWMAGAVVLGGGIVMSFFAVPQSAALVRVMTQTTNLPALTQIIFHYPVALMFALWLPLAVLSAALYRRKAHVNPFVRGLATYGLVSVAMLLYVWAVALPFCGVGTYITILQ